MTAFQISYNAFNGALISVNQPDLVPEDIQQMLALLAAEQKALVWLTLSREQAHLIPLFTAQGFVFHLCQEQSLTLICRLEDDAYAPFAPTHTVGVGGLILNDDAQVLLIRDKWMGGKGFKLPGGYIDLGESIAMAAEREVMEETGVRANFESVVSLVTKHPHQFEKSNLYIVCRLAPIDTHIQIQDTDEIEVAQWMNPVDFIEDEESSAFHRHMVRTLLNKHGLASDPFDFHDPTSEKLMYSLLS